MLVGACSSSHRNNSDNDAGHDSGLDSGDTDFPWDTGTDTEVLVVKPVFIFEDPPGRNNILALSTAFDGSHVAVSRAELDITEPY